MPSKIGQTEKDKYCMIFLCMESKKYICVYVNGKPMR